MNPSFDIRGLLAVAACAVALFGAGCGSDDEGDPIPADAAMALDGQLGSIEDRFAFGGGACGDIDKNRTDVERILTSIPESVDADVRDALRQSFDNLFELTSSQCEEETETETTPTETETIPTETETTPTETETTPTETETTEDKPGKGPKTDKDGGSGDEGGGGVIAPESD